jgi:mono/diheme cytochrome c family protein
LLAGWLVTGIAHLSDTNVWAGAQPPSKSPKAAASAERGRTVFNGKGVCHYCHGVDGAFDRRPEVESDTAALIARLNPPPPDLRNPKALRLKTDKQRTQAIREGHPGTGMFPDRTMTDQELADTLAYLALLRGDGASKKP